jgi:hypothetical protein
VDYHVKEVYSKFVHRILSNAIRKSLNPRKTHILYDRDVVMLHNALVRI